MVGGRGGTTRPQHCRPAGPAIANHLNRHDAHDHVSRRRDASDGEIQKPKTSRAYLPVLGSVPFLLGLISGQFRPTKKKQDRESRPQATGNKPQEQPGPDPKATATSRRPEPHTENTAQKVYFGGPTMELTSLESSTPRFLQSGRPRPGFLAVLVHATSDPTLLPPLVTVRAGT